VADPKPKIRTDRLALAFVALVVAAVLGVVGALSNWYAFALGEVSASPQPVIATSAVVPSPSVIPSTTPSATPSASSGTEEYRKGRVAGAADGYRAGRAQGRKDAIAHGKKRGFAAGKKDGYAAGYKRGYAAGYAVGYKKGHACVRPKAFCKSIGG